MDFGRLITAMVTPFDAEGQIDWYATEKLIHYLIQEQKTDSIVVCGTTGESPTLSDEEKIALFSFAVKHAKGRCGIIAGTGSNNTAHSVHLSKAAKDCGVDGLLLVAPYYNRPTQEGLYQHFKAVADAVDLPIMLYNVEVRTAVNISAETTLRLAEIPNIVATKDCASLDQLTKIAAGAPEGFKVYSGEDCSALPALSVGAYGIVSVASHVVGAEMKEMITQFVGGNVREATALHAKLSPMFKGLFIYPNPVPVKFVLSLKGMPVGGVRLPLIPATEDEQELLRELIQ